MLNHLEGRNPEYIQLNIDFAKSVTETGMRLGKLPNFLRPWVIVIVSDSIYKTLILTTATQSHRPLDNVYAKENTKIKRTHGSHDWRTHASIPGEWTGLGWQACRYWWSGNAKRGLTQSFRMICSHGSWNKPLRKKKAAPTNLRRGCYGLISHPLTRLRMYASPNCHRCALKNLWFAF